jgi:Spy/CpxP family protein refolding chaperone
MLRRAAALLCAAASLVAAIGLASAAQARPPENRPVGGLIARHAARLGLEGDALRAVQAVVEASGGHHAELLQKLDAARSAMRELLSVPVPDPDAVMAQAEAIGAVETELHKNRLTAILEIRALLSPEQRGELLKIREEERARREADPGGCGPGTPPAPGPPR